MEFISIGEISLKIVLDGSDMEKFGVRYETADYGSTLTKKVIRDILDAAKAATGFDAKGERLHIQVYPSAKGGCEMYISRIPQYGDAHNESRQVFVFASLDAAVDAAIMLCRSGIAEKCVMYECEGKWYISSPCGSRLCEYGSELYGALWEPYLAEHGKAVAEGENLERLVKALR